MDKVVFLSDSKDIVFTCQANEGETTSYRWERLNDTMPFDAEGINTNTLTLKLQLDYAGKYYCVATNDIGSSESNYATLKINSEYIYTCMCNTSFTKLLAMVFVLCGRSIFL